MGACLTERLAPPLPLLIDCILSRSDEGIGTGKWVHPPDVPAPYIGPLYMFKPILKPGAICLQVTQSLSSPRVLPYVKKHDEHHNHRSSTRRGDGNVFHQAGQLPLCNRFGGRALRLSTHFRGRGVLAFYASGQLSRFIYVLINSFFGQVRLVWPGASSFPKVLYYSNRYLTPISMMLCHSRE